MYQFLEVNVLLRHTICLLSQSLSDCNACSNCFAGFAASLVTWKISISSNGKMRSLIRPWLITEKRYKSSARVGFPLFPNETTI